MLLRIQPLHRVLSNLLQALHEEQMQTKYRKDETEEKRHESKLKLSVSVEVFFGGWYLLPQITHVCTEFVFFIFRLLSFCIQCGCFSFKEGTFYLTNIHQPALMS